MDSFKTIQKVIMALVMIPYFYVPQFEKTMAELTIEEKETISHRGRALRELISKL